MSHFAKKAQEAEQALIGAVLLTDRWLTECDLRPEDFLSDKGRIIWQSVLAVHAERQPVDLVTVSSHMKGRGYDWVRYLSELSRNTPSAANWKAYADVLKRYSRLARLSAILDEAKAEVLAGNDVGDSVISELMALGNDAGDYEADAKSMLRSTVETLDAIRAGRIKTVTTGLASLDDALSGLHPSNLIVVGGRPASGKTALLLNMADKAGVPVGIISSEMGRHQLGTRLLAINNGAPAEKLRKATLSDDEWVRITAVSGKMVKENRLFVNDRPKITIHDIERQARRWKHVHGIEALYVDYIQRIDGASGKDKKHEDVGVVVRGLKNIARELDIPVVALAQVSRKVEDRSEKRPFMGDLADSSEIEKEADEIITLYRDEVYNPDTRLKGILELIICKSRHGETKTVPVKWNGAFMQVRDLTEFERDDLRRLLGEGRKK